MTESEKRSTARSCTGGLDFAWKAGRYGPVSHGEVGHMRMTR